MISMFVLVTVAMISMFVLMGMGMSMLVGMLPRFVEDDIAADTGDPTAYVIAKRDRPAIERYFLEFTFQSSWVHTQSDHGAEIHVTADTSGALIVEGSHSQKSSGRIEWVSRLTVRKTNL